MHSFVMACAGGIVGAVLMDMTEALATRAGLTGGVSVALLYAVMLKVTGWTLPAHHLWGGIAFGPLLFTVLVGGPGLRHFATREQLACEAATRAGAQRLAVEAELACCARNSSRTCSSTPWPNCAGWCARTPNVRRR